MNSMRRTIAALEVVLIFPAALFMTALFVRNLQPQPFEPAHTAQRIVNWYATRTHLGLWLFLIALPVAVLAIGCLALVRSWHSDPALRQAALQCARAVRPYFAFLIVALATLASAAILAIVAVHLIAA